MIVHWSLFYTANGHMKVILIIVVILCTSKWLQIQIFACAILLIESTVIVNESQCTVRDQSIIMGPLIYFNQFSVWHEIYNNWQCTSEW